MFLKKIGRKVNFPNFGVYTDTALAGASVVLIEWIQTSIKTSVRPPAERLVGSTSATEAEAEYYVRLAKMQDNITFGMEYYMGIMIVCLIFKVLEYI